MSGIPAANICAISVIASCENESETEEVSISTHFIKRLRIEGIYKNKTQYTLITTPFQFILFVRFFGLTIKA
jgi:hypothetical protein